MYPNYNQYYRVDNCKNYISQENNGEIICFEEALDLIKKSIGNEKEDEMFYDQLIEQSPTQKEKNIIISIRNDEKKHNRILRELYYCFTGQILPKDMSDNNIIEHKTYKENLEKALFGELDAVFKYRKIMGAMPDKNSYTLVMSIMTDEIRHAIKYNFLIQDLK